MVPRFRAQLVLFASGVSLRYFVHTFGCQMNMHDSDRMGEVLSAHGWLPTDRPEHADLVVFNTCSVREKAEHKLHSELGKLAPFKAQNPEMVIAVAGCVAQQEGEALLKRSELLDLVIGPDNIAELPRLVLEQRSGALPLSFTVFDDDAPRFLAAKPKAGEAPISAFVTTMKGCDERCSFCVVPYTRGSERYRPTREIVAEAQRWVAAGSKEIVLLGQTVDSFQDPALPPPASDDPDESQFPHLLRAIVAQVPGLKRLRYTSPHPRHLTPSLIAAHAELEVLAAHVHMPVQSGSNRVLKRMIRRYTREEYLSRIAQLKAARPGLTLATDVIVGFCGETDEDFEDTLSLVREANVTSIFAFKYSVRPLTPARKLKDDVPEEVKSERLSRLLALADKLQAAHLQTLVGTTATVILEGLSKTDSKMVTGRTERNEIVHLPAPEGDVYGELATIKIVAAHKRSLRGEWIGEAPRGTGRPAKAYLRTGRSLPVVATTAGEQP